MRWFAYERVDVQRVSKLTSRGRSWEMIQHGALFWPVDNILFEIARVSCYYFCFSHDMFFITFFKPRLSVARTTVMSLHPDLSF